jgi:flagellar FliJ protein
MKKSKRLEPVVKVAENREQQATRALGEAQKRLAAAEQRLRELKQYREEYHARFKANGAAGMGAMFLEDYQKFLHKLSLAIQQQVAVIAQAAAAVEEKKRLWHVSRSKTQMIESVVARYQAQEQRQADRKEQGEQDQRSQRPATDRYP